jgi:hypothetical protein
MKTHDYLRKEGFLELTHPYYLPEEQDIFDNAVEQLAKGGKQYYVRYEDEMAIIYIRVECPLKK